MKGMFFDTQLIGRHMGKQKLKQTVAMADLSIIISFIVIYNVVFIELFG